MTKVNFIIILTYFASMVYSMDILPEDRESVRSTTQAAVDSDKKIAHALRYIAIAAIAVDEEKKTAPPAMNDVIAEVNKSPDDVIAIEKLLKDTGVNYDHIIYIPFNISAKAIQPILIVPGKSTTAGGAIVAFADGHTGVIFGYEGIALAAAAKTLSAKSNNVATFKDWESVGVDLVALMKLSMEIK